MQSSIKYYNPFWVILTAVVMCGFHTTFSQVSGTILEEGKNRPISDVEVFFDQCTGHAMTNEEGQFRIQNPASGFLTLVLYKPGYEMYSSSMRIAPGKAYTLNLELTPAKRKDETVQVSLSDQVDIGFRVVSYVVDSKKKFTRFQPFREADLSQQVEWEQKRKDVYEGSLRQWLSSLANGSSSDLGFETKVNGAVREPGDFVSKTNLPDYYRLSLPGPVEISHRGRSSSLTATGTLDVSENGLMLNGDQLKVVGSMGIARLPLDYEPIEGDIGEVFAELMKRYYEKVYVHTDKPYYYQGEPMWFKAYVNYYDLSLRDSLSRVLYVELISPEKEMVMEKMLKIDSGMAMGDFILPDTLKRGDYFLRAYTNLQRNFGDGQLYVRHVPILGITEKVNASQAVWDSESDGRIVIEPDKEVYGTREEITLKVTVKDGDGNPVKANLSVSVTDASQVVPIKSSSIADNYSIDDFEIDIPQLLRYPVERGITIQGIYFDEKGNPAKADLNLVQWKSNNAGLVETGEDGRFEVTGFDFYDSTRIFYSTSTKNVEKGKVVLEARDRPFVRNYEKDLGSLDVLVTESPQRVISEYEVPKDVRLLEDIEIVGQKFNNERIDRPYGTARYGTLIEKKDINVAMGDLNYSLVGKVPGLVVQQLAGGSWNVKITRLGFGGGEPLVTVNDVPIFGRTAGEAISMINPATVESIEVKKSINVLYGSQGAFGVIAIYTQPLDRGSESLVSAASVGLGGYSVSREYATPDYSNSRKESDQADYRSGLYWGTWSGEDLQLSFFTSDLETTYKIEVQGVDETNQPIYATQFITVQND